MLSIHTSEDFPINALLLRSNCLSLIFTYRRVYHQLASATDILTNKNSSTLIYLVHLQVLTMLTNGIGTFQPARPTNINGNNIEVSIAIFERP